MKKQFFSLVMMLALAIVAGSAFGQTSDVPWEGVAFTYTVDGLTANQGDDVSFVLTPIASADPSVGPIAVAGSAGTGVWYAAATTFTNITAITQAITITWGSSAAINGTVDNDYKLWVVVTDGTSNCTNYRYLGIDPRSNSFDVEVTAVGIADASATGLVLASGDQDGATECISSGALINEEYNVEATEANGQTWAYFRVNLNQPSPSAYSWKFGIAFSGFSVENDIEYSVDGSTWNNYVEDAVNTVPNTDLEVYVRVLTDASASSQAITATLSNLDLGTFGLPDVNAGNNAKSYTISAVPSVGTFSGF